MTVKERFSPFLVLLEARYAPLLFVAAPQAYTVYKWLYMGDKTNEGWFFAVIGALAFEFVYVAVIAWAEGKTSNFWVWLTAFSALWFSIMVSLRVYWHFDEGLSVLHAGFPLVAFFYTMTIHRAKGTEEQPTQPQPAIDPMPMLHEVLEAMQRQNANIIRNETGELWAAIQGLAAKLDEPKQEAVTLPNELPELMQPASEVLEEIKSLGRQMQQRKIKASEFDSLVSNLLNAK